MIQVVASAHFQLSFQDKVIFFQSCIRLHPTANILPLPVHEAPLPRLYRASISAPACRLPLLLHRIPAGFPSPADEYAESALDLNTYLIRNKVSTFFFRVIGDSMTGANIHDGDLLVVDRSIEPRHGHIVLAVINNEYTVKRLYRHHGVIELHAENPAYPPISFQEHDELQVWGVVIGAVSRFAV